MSAELIKRIDDILFDRGYKGRETPVSTDELVAIRAALSQSEPARYVPMTDGAIDLITKIYWGYGLTMPALLSAHRACARFIECEVIRRAGLEVAND